MKYLARSSIVLALAAMSCAIGNGDNHSEAWTLRIRDLSHREIVVASVRFSEERASSCMVGDWKRLVVDSSQTKGPTFFPLSEPLSYQFDGPELTIGRNDICDAYLHLRGKFDGVTAQGEYYSFGLREGRERGDFSLSKR